MRIADFLPHRFFEWSQHSAIGSWIAGATWVFAVLETIHIIGLCILLGSTLIVDLRLLGFGLRRSAREQVADEFEPWTLVTLGITVISGALLFLSEAIRLSTNGPFFYKMVFFSFAILIHFTIHWKAVMSGSSDAKWYGKLAACLSLCSWLLVALAGRGIAFLP